MKTIYLLLITIAAITFLLTACTKNNTSTGKARMQVVLTDDPGNYEEVNIEVEDVRVNYSGDSSKGWESLKGIKAGNYNILELVNGKEAVLADAEINTGRIQQIRLILGDNNSVKVDGKTYQMQTPSAQQSGLKLNIHQDVAEGMFYKLIMDFDASRSIVKTGNGKYNLKPVIRTSLEAIGGSVKGYVLPNNFSTAVYALQNQDTIAGTYTSNGQFMLKGLNAGMYTLAFVPTDNSYKQQTIGNVTVTVSKVTVIDTIQLVR